MPAPSKKLKRLILFPFGGNAREALMTVLDINKQEKTWDVIGFADDDPSTHGKSCAGVKGLGDKTVFKKYPDAYVLAVPGNPDNYLKRPQIIKDLGLAPDRFATIVHPTAVVAANAKVGLNTLLMAHVTAGCDVTIGNHCVILPNTTVAHDSVIEDFCCVGANVVMSGQVRLKSNCYVGSGSNLRDRITVGKKSLIGLGSNVLENVEDEAVVAGNPARELKKIK